MKTMISNKIYLSMAALAIVGAMMSSCAEEIEVAQPANTDKTVMVKTTVSLDENATTRALTSNGEKTFAVGEQIAVIYENTSNQTVKAVSEALAPGDIDTDNTHKATFSVPLTNPKPSGTVRYVYPASMAALIEADKATNDDAATLDYSLLETQDGTLASLASGFDLATFDGNLTDQGVLPAATLTNRLAIGKFTIKDGSGTDVTSDITGLNISDGTNTYTVNRTAAAGPIYVAMEPVNNKTVTVSVTASNNKYSNKSVSEVTLDQNSIYSINVSMTARYPLAAADASVSAEDIGSVLGADGNIYLNAAAATAASSATTAIAVIAYVGDAGSADASSPTYKGLALALTDANGGNKTKWCTQEREPYAPFESCLTTHYDSDSDAENDMAGIDNTNYLIDHAPTGHTHVPASAARNYNSGTHPTGTSAWFLPSDGQWAKMVNAAGGDQNLKTNASLQPVYYWSSTECETYGAWHFNFTGNGRWINTLSDKHQEYYVRAALAF